MPEIVTGDVFVGRAAAAATGGSAHAQPSAAIATAKHNAGLIFLEGLITANPGTNVSVRDQELCSKA